jgi:hypothetical protein
MGIIFGYVLVDVGIHIAQGLMTYCRENKKVAVV